MYTKFKNEVIAKLINLDTETLEQVSMAMDLTSTKFTFGEGETALSVIDDNYSYHLVELWLGAKKVEGAAKGTLKNYGYHIRLFLEYMPKPFCEITTPDVQMFLFNYQKDRNVSNRSLDKVRQSICNFFTWLVDNEYIVKNPCKNVHKIKYQEKQRKSLDKEQIVRLKKACTNIRDKCIVNVMLSSGCRIAELSNMKISDINFNSKEVLVTGKGNKQRICYLGAEAIDSIYDYLNSRTDDCEYLIVSTGKDTHKMSTDGIRKSLAHLCKDCGVEFTPHILRHTYATFMVRCGQITHVQKTLGHTNLQTTLVYAETDQNEVKHSHEYFAIS